MTKIFLARHATPDWDRKDIPYDIPPGPPLSPKGEKEAEELAIYLKAQNVVKLYHSPFERTARTAQIIAVTNGIPCTLDVRLAEWRGQVEPEAQVRIRMKAIFQDVLQEIHGPGAIGLVSHGGPTDLLLQELGIDLSELAKYKTRFDTVNPLPPAGAWATEWDESTQAWKFQLAFVPSVVQ